eukprot:8948249-Pyramimonas_sp.AAC.1
MRSVRFAICHGRAGAVHASSLTTHGRGQRSLRRNDFVHSAGAARGGNQSDPREPSEAFGLRSQ